MGIISGQGSVDSFADIGVHYGDPSIFLATPTRQLRSDYTFLTPDTYYSDFVALTFPPEAEISLDGVSLDLSQAQSIENSTSQYIYVELTDGAHHVESSSPFGIMVFAFDDFVSYAFTGGLNFTKR